jgi:hypothetical protein
LVKISGNFYEHSQKWSENIAQKNFTHFFKHMFFQG